MYEISTQASFSAAHHLQNYNGPCENVHGHNWLVKAFVRCKKLDDIGLGIDFRSLRKALDSVLAELDHADLNVAFERLGINPSSENIACYIYERLQLLVDNSDCRISKVEVSETPGNIASYFEDTHA
jgi:6-pyruvoyltetrahydropterin/6-carboxytetrahydropterin synthase